jgi:putative salt-induced outer membrane protein YdiY
MKLTTHILLPLLLTASLATADIVRTIDGAQLTGTITLIDKGVIHLDTPYAGTLKIKQDQVASFQSDEARVVRLASGTVMAGPIASDAQGTIRIQSEDGVLETSTAKVSAAWSPGAEDPEVARNRREWRYEASLDLTGKSGNTDKFRLGTSLNAELKGPDDTLAFFFEYEQAEEEDNKTEDRAIGGGSYESFFSEVLGWYVRTELETDNIDNVKLRSTSAGGLSYRIINKDFQTLVARSGLGYRYTAYDNATEDESSATLDFGLAHTYRFNEIFRMKNDLTFVPSMDDFAVYRVVHDSGVEIPVGSGDNWKIRMGIRNEYESETAAEEKLDTSYYTKMIYSWD